MKMKHVLSAGFGALALGLLATTAQAAPGAGLGGAVDASAAEGASLLTKVTWGGGYGYGYGHYRRPYGYGYYKPWYKPFYGYGYGRGYGYGYYKPRYKPFYGYGYGGYGRGYGRY